MFPEMGKQTIETEVMAELINGGWGGTILGDFGLATISKWHIGECEHIKRYI